MWCMGVVGDYKCGLSRVLVYMLFCGWYGLPHRCLKCTHMASIHALLYVLTRAMLQVCCVGDSECNFIYFALLSSTSWRHIDACVCLLDTINATAVVTLFFLFRTFYVCILQCMGVMFDYVCDVYVVPAVMGSKRATAWVYRLCFRRLYTCATKRSHTCGVSLCFSMLC